MVSVHTRSFEQSRGYAIVIRNLTVLPTRFDVVPDIGFGHFSCANGILPKVLAQGVTANGGTEAIVTIISGVNMTVSRNPETEKHTVLPFRTLCGGWWLPDEQVRRKYRGVRLLLFRNWTDRDPFAQTEEIALALRP
jgi:hypothetical protein